MLNKIGRLAASDNVEKGQISRGVPIWTGGELDELTPFVDFVAVPNRQDIDLILLNVKFVNDPIITDPEAILRRISQAVIWIFCQPEPHVVQFLLDLLPDVLRQLR